MIRILALLCLAAAPLLAVAQIPDRPVKLLVPFPPGGAADTFARLAGDRLATSLGRQVLVENRPGAGGIIATEATAKSAPDGTTYLIVTVGHAVNPSLYSKLPYDTLADLAPVAMVASLPNVLVVHPSVAATNVAELIALAKKSPGSLKYASSGNATTSHMAAALLSSLAGVELLHVPYKGAAPAVQDLVAGRVDLMLDPTVSVGNFVKQGRVKALAVTTAKRTPLLPELPTLAEAGVPGYEFQAWFLLVAPAKTPATAIARVNADLAKISTDGSYREKLASLGAEPVPPASPEQVGAFIAAEVKRWAKVVKDAGIKVE